MKRQFSRFLSLFLPFIASSCCYQHNQCEWQDNCNPWSFTPKSCCNEQIVCSYEDQNLIDHAEPATNPEIITEPTVSAHVLGGQKEIKPVESDEPAAPNFTLDLQENPTKYLHFIATLDEHNFLTLIVKNKGTIPIQEITVRVSIPSLPRLSTEGVLVRFNGSVAEGASLTAQTKIGPFANFDELKDSLEVNFVAAIPSAS